MRTLKKWFVRVPSETHREELYDELARALNGLYYIANWMCPPEKAHKAVCNIILQLRALHLAPEQEREKHARRIRSQLAYLFRRVMNARNDRRIKVITRVKIRFFGREQLRRLVLNLTEMYPDLSWK